MKYIHFEGFNPLLERMEKAFAAAWTAGGEAKSLYDRYTRLYATTSDGQYWDAFTRKHGQEATDLRWTGVTVTQESLSLALELAVRKSRQCCTVLGELCQEYRKEVAVSKHPGRGIETFGQTEAELQRELRVGLSNTLVGERLLALLTRENERYEQKNKGYHASKYAVLAVYALMQHKSIQCAVDISEMVYIPFRSINLGAFHAHTALTALENALSGTDGLSKEGVEAKTGLTRALADLKEDQHLRKLEHAVRTKVSTDSLLAEQAMRRCEFSNANLTGQEVLSRLKQHHATLVKLLDDAVRYTVHQGEHSGKVEVLNEDSRILGLLSIHGNSWPFDGRNALEVRVLLNNLVWSAAQIDALKNVCHQLESDLKAVPADTVTHGNEALTSMYSCVDFSDASIINWKGFEQLADAIDCEAAQFLKAIESDPAWEACEGSREKLRSEVMRAISEYMQAPGPDQRSRAAELRRFLTSRPLIGETK